ncbi:MAG TPA: hypothetical protein VEG32_01755 [Clostridia bacterium]|nr:hypothetical protein [Clostridia bacterium]
MCLSGQPRTFERCIGSIIKAFEGFRVDWFIGTWATSENFAAVANAIDGKMQPAMQEYVSEPSLVRQERKILESFIDSFPDFFILHQWYGVSRAMKLRNEWCQREGVEHDIIVRCRFDLDLKFSFADALKNFVPDAVHMTKAQQGGGDQFFFGTPDTMTRLVDFPHWLVSYGDRFGTEYGFFATPLLRAFFLDNRIRVNTLDMPLRIVRPPMSGSPREVREQRTRDYIARTFPDMADHAWVGERIPKTKTPAPWDKGYPANAGLFLRNGEPVT